MCTFVSCFMVENESWYACDLGERDMGLRGPSKGLVRRAFKNGGRCWMMKFKLYVVSASNFFIFDTPEPPRV